MLELNSRINILGQLTGFSERNSQPRDLNDLGSIVSEKSDRMTGRSAQIALSEKFSSKSF